MVDTRNIWMNTARQEIAQILQQVMDERYSDIDTVEFKTDDMGDYYAGYFNAVLDIARKFNFGFYAQEDGSDKIKDLLK